MRENLEQSCTRVDAEAFLRGVTALERARFDGNGADGATGASGDIMVAIATGSICTHTDARLAVGGQLHVLEQSAAVDGTADAAI
jgi:hypothetical protein